MGASFMNLIYVFLATRQLYFNYIVKIIYSIFLAK